MPPSQEAKYLEAFEAFELLWTNKGLPLDARRFICGSVQAAGRKQGEEVFPEQYMEKAAREEPLHPDEQIEMFEKVTDFVLKKKRLRPQYLLVILHNAVNFLNENYEHVARNLEERIRHMAEMN